MLFFVLPVDNGYQAGYCHLKWGAGYCQSTMSIRSGIVTKIWVHGIAVDNWYQAGYFNSKWCAWYCQSTMGIRLAIITQNGVQGIAV